MRVERARDAVDAAEVAARAAAIEELRGEAVDASVTDGERATQQLAALHAAAPAAPRRAVAVRLPPALVAAERAAALVARLVDERVVPRNSAHFEALVHELLACACARAEHAAHLARYVRSVPPAALPQLFTSELDDAVLELLLLALANEAADLPADFRAAFLRALRHMPRFDMFEMLADDAAKENMRKIEAL